MTPEEVRATLSKYFDGELDRAEAGEVEQLLATSEEARRHLEQLKTLRRQLRYEPAEPGPDVTRRVVAAVERNRERRVGRLRVVAAFAAGVVAGVVFIGAAIRQPVPVAVAGIPGQVLAAQSQVTSLTAGVHIVERGWHREVEERVFNGEIEYLAPENLRVTMTDDTRYPSAAWVPNDSIHVVDERIAWSSATAGCPSEALPGCTPVEPRILATTDREPFPDARPAPLDLIVPVAGFSRASEPLVLGVEDIDGREAVGVEVTAAQAAALIDGLISDGNWRGVHPTDRVELWLDGTALVPLAMNVYPADTADRRLWAVRHGYVDSPDTPILEVSWSEVTVNDMRNIDLPAPPAAADGSSYGFRDGEVDGLSVMTPSNLPDGMTLHRTGIVDTGAGPSVSVATWSDGRAWLKVRWTDDWDDNRLFGDLGTLVRQVPIGTGVGYLDERGEKVGIHGVDIDVAVMGSLPIGDLVDLSASLDVVGVAIPDIWAESGTATADTASEDVKGLLIPRGLEGFGAPTIRSRVGVVTLAYAGAGNRGFLLTQARDGRLSPPLEANVRGVDVRGVEGRYSPDRGLLEWVESGLTISITSTTMTVDELVAIAGMLQEP